MAENKYEIYGVRHTYIEWNNAGSMAFKRAWMTNKCDIKVSNAQLEFSGDGQKFRKNYGYQAEGTIEVDVDDDTIDGILFGSASVAPLGGDDFAVRYVKGADTEMQPNFVGVRLSLDAANSDTGAPAVIRFRVLRVQFTPDTPQPNETEKVGGRMLVFNARKTKVDIVGVTPTGMPSRGCFWLRDIITNANNFDPVPGDLL